MGSNPLSGGLIGQLAVARGMITPEQLRQCLETHGKNGTQRLGETLVGQGLLTPQQLQQLLHEQAAIQTQQRRAGPSGVAPGAMKAKLKPSNRGATGSADGGIDLDLAESDPGDFEIENGGSTRTIEKAENTPARAQPAAAPVRGHLAPDGGASLEPARASAPMPAGGPSYDPLATAGGKTIADLVMAASRAMASDLHLHTGYPLVIRQGGRIVASPGGALTRAQLEPALNDLLPPDRRRELAERGQTESTFTIPGIARCRVQITTGSEGPSAVVRIIPPAIPTLTALGLPSAIARLVTVPGLVLIAGPANCGKSWTLAALVDIVNAERREHIVCVEEPIEFLHPSKRCSVSQREVPTHAASVARAVKAALHEDPDVLVIGEIDDAETMFAAMTAAEAGRLVLATIAAGNASRAIARAIGLFPGDSQALAATTLADTLRAVVGQRLVPMSDGVRRIALTEILEVDADTAGKIAAADVRGVVPKTTFDQALVQAMRAGNITRDEARRHADRPESI